MRLFLIISEGNFYQPDFVADLLRRTGDEVVGAALVTKAPPKGDLEKYLVKHFYYLTPNELFRLAAEVIESKLKNLILKKTRSGKFYSVKSVLNTFNIPYFEAEHSINKEEYLSKIREYRPDIIISSNPLIFKEKLLSIPTKGCVNRHSALLPAYGGLWPVFQAVRAGEKETGVTVHTMVREIDKGVILSQKSVPITKSSTVAELYQKTFDLSAEAVIEALEKIRSGSHNEVRNDLKPSYFSLPTQAHWKEFRKRGGVFI